MHEIVICVLRTPALPSPVPVSEHGRGSTRRRRWLVLSKKGLKA